MSFFTWSSSHKGFRKIFRQDDSSFLEVFCNFLFLAFGVLAFGVLAFGVLLIHLALLAEEKLIGQSKDFAYDPKKQADELEDEFDWNEQNLEEFLVKFALFF